MGLRLCVLGSGSSGNCTFVGSERTRILVDAGLSCRETVRRLEAAGVSGGVDAICVTHEHDDHTASLGALHRRFGAPLYANAATVEALERGGKAPGLAWNVFATGQPFEIGDLRIEPFSVPHDAYDPVGFVVSRGDSRAGIVTDMGTVTELIRVRLRGCQALIVESNHDEKMLRDAKRPWSLKQRIAGRQGHLSNEGAARLLEEVATPALRVVFLAHLSADCNREALAVEAVRAALARRADTTATVKPTYADRPADLVEI